MMVYTTQLEGRGGEGRGGEGQERGGMTVIHILIGMFNSNAKLPQLNVLVTVSPRMWD